MEFSCVGAPKRCSLGLTALLHSEIIMGCQNSFIDLMKPSVWARKAKMTCRNRWGPLLCDFCSGGYLEQVPASTNRHSRTFPYCSQRNWG